MRIFERLTLSIIEANWIMEGVFDPSIFKAVFVSGPAGAGKGYTTKATMGGIDVDLTPDGSNVVLTTTHGMKVVNSDNMLEILMTHNDISLDMTKHTTDMAAKKDMVRKLAKDITGRQMDYYISARLGVVIDGTASDVNKIIRIKNELESLGYDTYMVFVSTDLETAQRRNMERARNIPEDVVFQKYQETQQALKEYKSMFGSNLLIVDNSGKGAEQSVMDAGWKAISKFTSKSITNPIAKEWIADHGGRK